MKGLDIGFNLAPVLQALFLPAFQHTGNVFQFSAGTGAFLGSQLDDTVIIELAHVLIKQQCAFIDAHRRIPQYIQKRFQALHLIRMLLAGFRLAFCGPYLFPATFHQFPEHTVQIAEAWNHGCRRFLACFQNRIRLKLPFIKPFLIQVQLVFCRLPAHMEPAQNGARAFRYLAAAAQGFLSVLNGPDMLIPELQCQLVCRREREILALDGNHVPDQHQNHFLGQAKLLHPFIIAHNRLTMQVLVIPENGIHCLGKAGILLVRCRRFTQKHGLIGMKETIRRFLIPDPLHQADSLPVPECILNLLLAQVQIMLHLAHAHILRLICTDHEPIQIHLQRFFAG